MRARRVAAVAAFCVGLICSTVVFAQNPPDASMVLIPEGSFVMGGNTNVGLFPVNNYEKPQHTVRVSGFYMDAYEVYQNLWNWVKAYNGGNGYTYSNPGAAKSNLHPIHTVNWFDAVKWCNARSEYDGLTPVYYTDANLRTIYKTGEIVPYVNWFANGYRLPTEAEWEKAARGGVADTRFPWTDFTNRISHAKANYFGGSIAEPWDLSVGTHPLYVGGGSPITCPVGDLGANSYGLYCMIGNVFEWCWDRYLTNYYASSPAVDPRGPSTGGSRVMRGGSWIEGAYTCSSRSEYGPEDALNEIGFRCVARRVKSVGDYNDNTRSDFPVFNPPDGAWYIRTAAGATVTWSNRWGWSTARPVVGDYNGDGRWDLAVFDTVGGYWYIKNVAGGTISWENQWGWSTAKPVPGDYNGDGRWDQAVFDTVGGYWYIKNVSGGVISWANQWGWSTARPVPGDYNGDGRWDMAVFDTVGGYWFIKNVTGGVITWANQWGWSTARPVPGDYDGDGRWDLAVFDTVGGFWYIKSLTRGVITWNNQWGWSTAKPVPGDYNGDGKYDLAVYDTATGLWYVKSVDGHVIAWASQWGWPGAVIPALEAAQ